MRGSSGRGTKRSTDFHQWVNSVLAVLAFFVAMASACFSFQANELHKLNLVMSAARSSVCEAVRLSVQPGLGLLHTCWRILISNQSEDRAVVTSIEATDLKHVKGPLGDIGVGIIFLTPLPRVPNDNPFLPGAKVVDPKSASFPLRIDAGDAALVDVSLNVLLTDSQVQLIKKNPWGFDSLSASQGYKRRTLCAALNDVDSSGKCDAHFRVQLETARGSAQSLQLTFPDQMPSYVSDDQPGAASEAPTNGVRDPARPH